MSEFGNDVTAWVKTMWDALKLIYKRLPWIAVAFLSVYIVIVAGGAIYKKADQAHVNAQSANAFVNYSSFYVNNARENEDVSFTVCRNRTGTFATEATRTIFIIPDGGSEQDRIEVYSDIKPGTIGGQQCASYFVRQKDYHFKPGKYQLGLVIRFKVKYDIQKTVPLDSNIFTIYAQPNAPATNANLDGINQRLDKLDEQLTQLQRITPLPSER